MNKFCLGLILLSSLFARVSTSEAMDMDFILEHFGGVEVPAGLADIECVFVGHQYFYTIPPDQLVKVTCYRCPPNIEICVSQGYTHNGNGDTIETDLGTSITRIYP